MPSHLQVKNLCFIKKILDIKRDKNKKKYDIIIFNCNLKKELKLIYFIFIQYYFNLDNIILTIENNNPNFH